MTCRKLDTGYNRGRGLLYHEHFVHPGCETVMFLPAMLMAPKVLQGALEVVTSWITGADGEEVEDDEEQQNHISSGHSREFGEGILSRLPCGWWGEAGDRILALMQEERRSLLRKRSALTTEGISSSHRVVANRET